MQINPRDWNLKKNVLVGAAFQVGGIALILLAMPMMLNMLGQASLGVWLTLLSIFQWLSYFDLGVASGVRNALARSLSAGDMTRSKSLIATGYWYTTLITLSTSAFFLCAYFMLSANKFFLEPGANSTELNQTVIFSLALITLSLILGFVHQLYAATEQPAAFPFSGFLANFLFVLLLFTALIADSKSMALLGTLYGSSLCLSRGFLTARFFWSHPELRPAWQHIDNSLRYELLSFGVKIFIIQLCAMVLFTTDKILISWLLEPGDVVKYESAFRLFSLVSVFHSLIMNSYWSSFTHAASSGDWKWIRHTLRRLVAMMLPVIAIAVTLSFVSTPLITLWMGVDAISKNSMYWTFAAYTVLSCWSNIFAYFVNGIGRVNLQLISAIVAASINIPLSIILVRNYDLGITGIVLATVISLGLFSVLGPLQTKQILAGEAR